MVHVFEFGVILYIGWGRKVLIHTSINAHIYEIRSIMSILRVTHDSSVIQVFFQSQQLFGVEVSKIYSIHASLHKTELKVSSIQLICLIELLVVVLLVSSSTHMAIIPLYICIIDQS